jgi:hypothetical protein
MKHLQNNQRCREDSSEKPHHVIIGAGKATGRVGVCATITIVEDFLVDHELVYHDDVTL